MVRPQRRYWWCGDAAVGVAQATVARACPNATVVSVTLPELLRGRMPRAAATIAAVNDVLRTRPHVVDLYAAHERNSKIVFDRFRGVDMLASSSRESRRGRGRDVDIPRR